jgi:hypothetical protein
MKLHGGKEEKKHWKKKKKKIDSHTVSKFRNEPSSRKVRVDYPGVGFGYPALRGCMASMGSRSVISG